MSKIKITKAAFIFLCLSYMCVYCYDRGHAKGYIKAYNKIDIATNIKRVAEEYDNVHIGNLDISGVSIVSEIVVFSINNDFAVNIGPRCKGVTVKDTYVEMSDNRYYPRQ